MKKNNCTNVSYSYDIYGEEPSKSSDYQPLSYEQAFEQRENSITLSNRPDPTPPIYKKYANRVAAVSLILLLVVPIFTVLAFVTDGGIFLLEKTQAEITYVEKSSFRTRDREYISYSLSVDYDYKGKPYSSTVYFKNELLYRQTYPIGGNVFVYVSRINPRFVIYLNSSQSITVYIATPIIISALMFIAAEILSTYRPGQPLIQPQSTLGEIFDIRR